MTIGAFCPNAGIVVAKGEVSMALDRRVENHFVNRMDYHANGHLHAIAEKASAIDAPVLILGLGGLGAEAVLCVKEMIHNNIECDSEFVHGIEIGNPKNIEYYVIDTDINAERLMYNGIGFNSGDAYECHLMCDPNIQDRIQNIDQEYISSWLNRDIRVHQVLSGSGGVRQIGRLMLFLNIPVLRERLRAKIQRITEPFTENQPLYVFVVTGLGGGTGSGMFIDVPFLIKKIAEEINPVRNVRTIGMFVLPDYSEAISYSNSRQRDQMFGNTYAALKELNNLMNAGITGHSFHQSYGIFDFDGNAKPYDICTVISGENISQNGERKSKGELCKQIADVISNLMIPMNPPMLNILDDFYDVQTLYGEDSFFSVIGSAEWKLPLDEVLSYLAHTGFPDAHDAMKREPEEQELTALIEALGLDKQQMIRQIWQNGPEKMREDEKVFELIKEIGGRESVRMRYEQSFHKFCDQVHDRVHAAEEAFERLINDLQGPVYATALDTDKGFGYVWKCLDTYGDKCVLTHLHSLYAFMNEDIYRSQDYTRNLEAELERIISDMNRPMLLLKKRSINDAFWANWDQMFEVRCRVEMEKLLIDYLKKCIDLLKDLINVRLSVERDLEQLLLYTFQSYGNIEHLPGTARNEDDISVKASDLIPTLKDRMRHWPGWQVDPEAVRRELYELLAEHSSGWKQSDFNGAVDLIDETLAECFAPVTDRSMDDYLTIIAGPNPQNVHDYCGRLLDALRRQADFQFPVGWWQEQVRNYPETTYIFTPGNAGYA